MKYIIKDQIPTIVINGEKNFPNLMDVDVNMRAIALVITKYIDAFFKENKDDNLRVKLGFRSIIMNTDADNDSHTKSAIRKLYRSDIEFIESEFSNELKKVNPLNKDEDIKKYAKIVSSLTMDHIVNIQEEFAKQEKLAAQKRRKEKDEAHAKKLADIESGEYLKKKDPPIAVVPTTEDILMPLNPKFAANLYQKQIKNKGEKKHRKEKVQSNAAEEKTNADLNSSVATVQNQAGVSNNPKTSDLKILLPARPRFQLTLFDSSASTALTNEKTAKSQDSDIEEKENRGFNSSYTSEI